MRVYIKTFGCSANKSDSEVMAGLLVLAGHIIVSSMGLADVVIINSCGVKGRAEIDFFREVEAAKKLKKKIIAAGCIPSGNRALIDTKLRGISVMDVNSITQIVSLAEKTLHGKCVIAFRDNKIEKICLPRQRLNKVIAIVPISEGCVGACAYCFTKLAKGGLFSYSEGAILKEVKTAIADGCKEIWLTSQDCAAYGLDTNTNLAKLLDKICKIPGDFYVRVGMGNPNHIIKILPKLIEAYKNKKVFKFLHIPVQSGNDRVLKLMNRFYTVEDFRRIVKKFKTEIKNLTIITDIICGFPTETDKEFSNSVDLIRWLQPDAINVSMFWPRPGTTAEKMKQLSGEIKKKRSRDMTKLYHNLALNVNKKLIGQKFKVLIDEIGKKGGFVTRNLSYKPIVLKTGKLMLGDSLNVKIIDATKNYLIGKSYRK